VKVKGPHYLTKKSSAFVIRQIFCKEFIAEFKNGKKNVWSRAHFSDNSDKFRMEPCFGIF